MVLYFLSFQILWKEIVTFFSNSVFAITYSDIVDGEVILTQCSLDPLDDIWCCDIRVAVGVRPLTYLEEEGNVEEEEEKEEEEHDIAIEDGAMRTWTHPRRKGPWEAIKFDIRVPLNEKGGMSSFFVLVHPILAFLASVMSHHS